MRLKLAFSLSAALAFGYAANVSAQTCSCAGAPILSSLESSATSQGAWFLGTTYRYHPIGALVTGSEQTTGGVRERTTHTMLVEASYGITSAWSVTGLFSLVQHERNVSGVASDERLSTRGIGDAVLLVKYSLVRISLFSPWELALGGGVKAPTGVSDATDNGIVVSEDMQPGSGSWDEILWLYGARALNPATTHLLIANASFRLTGTNERDYRFGDEFLASLGYARQTDKRINYGLSMRYRWTGSDHRSGWLIPNTGGGWLSLVPTASLRLTRSLGITASGEVPLYRSLNGTQLTTSYAISASVFYNLQ